MTFPERVRTPRGAGGQAQCRDGQQGAAERAVWPGVEAPPRPDPRVGVQKGDRGGLSC